VPRGRNLEPKFSGDTPARNDEELIAAELADLRRCVEVRVSTARVVDPDRLIEMIAELLFRSYMDSNPRGVTQTFLGNTPPEGCNGNAGP
jgi:hypothetical protein